jgi:XRE family transcriptional regulator, fatty acid utilization regulator
MEDLKIRIATAIREIREKLKITQSQLADMIGVGSAQIISEIEKGSRDVKAVELAKIERALKTDIFSLIDSKPTVQPKILWRQPPLEGRELIEQEFMQFGQRWKHLEKITGEIKDDITLPKFQIDWKNCSPIIVSKIALEVSNQFSLGAIPAVSLEKILAEKYNVKIWYRKLPNDVSGACTKNEYGYFIITNACEPPWRRNFSTAHELFHLISWDSMQDEQTIVTFADQIERFANVFASVLLLPDEPLLIDYENIKFDNKVSFMNLIGLARKYGVSTHALMIRLDRLGKKFNIPIEQLINDPRFKELDRSTMYGTWQDPPKIPANFILLGFNAMEQGKISRMRLAEYLQVPLIDLPDFFAQYNLNEDEDYQTQISAT